MCCDTTECGAQNERCEFAFRASLVAPSTSQCDVCNSGIQVGVA